MDINKQKLSIVHKLLCLHLSENESEKNNLITEIKEELRPIAKFHIIDLPKVTLKSNKSLLEIIKDFSGSKVGKQQSIGELWKYLN